MAMTQNLTSQFALDVQGLQRLKYSAAQSPEGSLKAASQQFEAVFLQMMLKSMREASPTSGLFDSQQMDLMTSMQDQQWAQTLAGRGIGLADELVKQLEGSGLAGTQAGEKAGGDDDFSTLIAGIPRGTPQPLTGRLVQVPEDTAGAKAIAYRDAVAASSQPESLNAVERVGDAKRADHVEAFVAKLARPARHAEQVTGVPAELILAQAALETGWGKREIPTAQGANSHNLFGIKAGRGWSGETTAITTTEYADGRPHKQIDEFRVYPSFADAFADYAKLIGDNPRYAAVLEAATPERAAQALQQSGYATDPRYADKLSAIMGQLGPLDPVRGEPLIADVSAYQQETRQYQGSNQGPNQRLSANPTSIF